MKWAVVLLKSPGVRLGHVIAAFNSWLLSAQEQDLTPAEIDERFRTLIQCGF
jgi:hypothetical protein